MLVTLNNVLRQAQIQHYAIGAFNTTNLEISDAIISAAEATLSPIVIQTSEKAIAYAGLAEIAAIILTRAKRSKIPIVFHFDHGRNINLIKQAMEIGYTSIMFDGSNLSYEENMKITSDITRIAHEKGISVEAELGTIGGAEDSINGTQGLTNPHQAAEFVKLTHCDALAVAIGNNHGKPVKDEKLRLDVLQSISQAVRTPLVLHGASSTPEDEIKQAIKLGITKINIDTDIRMAFVSAEREILLKDREIYDPRKILEPAHAAVKQVVMRKIVLFGSQGKANC